MRITEAFPSQYLKAADLQKRTIRVVIDRVAMEDIGSDNKPILYFRGKDKGLVLNKTNANNIVYLFGEETDTWAGREIELFPTLVDFQGRQVEAIRVRPTSGNGQVPPAGRAATSDREPPPPLDDDIPF